MAASGTAGTSCVPETETTRLVTSAAEGQCNDEWPEEWHWRDLRILCSLISYVIGIVGLAYAWNPLLAAYEADGTMIWTPHETAAAGTITGLVEAMGLGLAGPAGDYIHGSSSLAAVAATCAFGVGMSTLMFSARVLIATYSCVLFVKGLTWATVCALLASNVHAGKQDVLMIAIVVASRASEMLNSTCLGDFMLHGDTWRVALQKYTGISCALYVVAFFLMPKDLTPPGDSEFSFAGLGGKLRVLVQDVNAWLTLLTLGGTYTVWALYTYMNVIMVDNFVVSPGEGAGNMVYFAFGATLGMVTAFLVTVALGKWWGRTFQVLQAVFGIGVAAVLTFTRLSLNATLAMYAALGWAFVPVAYLPLFIYAAGGPACSRALRMGVLDGFSYLTVQTGLNFSFGVYRAKNADNPRQVAVTMYSATLLGMMLATSCMSSLYWRLYKTGDKGSTDMEGAA